MLKSSRTNAILEILKSVDNSTIATDKILARWGRANRYAGSKDRSHIAQVVYAILRQRSKLDWWGEKLQMPTNSRIRVISYLCFSREDLDVHFNQDDRHSPSKLEEYELEYIQELKDVKSITSAQMPTCVQLNIPEWLLEYLEPAFKEDLKKELDAFSTEAPVDIRVNTLKTDLDYVRKELNNQNIKVKKLRFAKDGLRLERRFPLSGLEIFKNGFFEIQDESSQIASALINAKKGQAVVDFCAGAGGKTLAISAHMQNSGRIVACDISAKRLLRAAVRFKRAGVNNVQRRTLTSERDKWIKRRKARFDGGFDKVIVDTPCSGSGTWRRNPDQKWRISPTSIINLNKVQQNILQSAKRLVAKGGQLIYITCSILPQENQHQIEIFLKDNPDFQMVDIKKVWQEVFDCPAPCSSKTLTLTPYRTNNDGFFVAILEKKDSIKQNTNS